ncbi:MAG: hypothetical protein SPG61_05950 [Arcanobacterium sp.]|nr:hypothetical protein [Arcanobacterium sp.]
MSKHTRKELVQWLDANGGEFQRRSLRNDICRLWNGIYSFSLQQELDMNREEIIAQVRTFHTLDAETAIEVFMILEQTHTCLARFREFLDQVEEVSNLF